MQILGDHCPLFHTKMAGYRLSNIIIIQTNISFFINEYIYLFPRCENQCYQINITITFSAVYSSPLPIHFLKTRPSRDCWRSGFSLSLSFSQRLGFDPIQYPICSNPPASDSRVSFRSAIGESAIDSKIGEAAALGFLRPLDLRFVRCVEEISL
jgi:hypothetical protein